MYSQLFRIIYKLLLPFRNQIVGMRWLTKILFNVDIPEGLRVDYDMTTLLLSHVLKRIVTPNKRVLEIGIGTGALLSIGLAKKNKSVAYGVDISQKRVTQSKYISKYNSVNENFIQSDLFANVHGRFDLLLFNPPYLPTNFGKDIGLFDVNLIDHTGAWDGGSEGTDVISDFLVHSENYLEKGGLILLGIQGLYISESQILEIIEKTNLFYEGQHRLPLITSRVYFFTTRT